MTFTGCMYGIGLVMALIGYITEERAFTLWCIMFVSIGLLNLYIRKPRKGMRRKF